MYVLTPPPINRKRKFTELKYESQQISRFLIEISGKISGFQQRFLGISPKVYEISTSVGPLGISSYKGETAS